MNDIVKITGKCLLCGDKEVLSSQQILDAEINGAVVSSCCYFPMVIEKVEVKFSKK